MSVYSDYHKMLNEIRFDRITRDHYATDTEYRNAISAAWCRLRTMPRPEKLWTKYGFRLRPRGGSTK